MKEEECRKVTFLLCCELDSFGFGGWWCYFVTLWTRLISLR